jgi:hypothetical protein
MVLIAIGKTISIPKSNPVQKMRGGNIYRELLCERKSLLQVRDQIFNVFYAYA